MWRVTISVVVLIVFLLGTVLAAAHPPGPPVPADVQRGPIKIDRDADFVAANGVTGGSGTASDPFVIDGWDISAASGVAISIANTTAHYVLRNVTVHSGGQNYPGIRLYDAPHGRVEDSRLLDSTPGIYAVAAAHLTVTGSTFSSSSNAAWVWSSPHLTFSHDTFVSGGIVEIFDSSWVNMTENNATGHIFALHGHGSASNYNVSGNMFRDLYAVAIALDSIDGVVVEGNRITGPGTSVGIGGSTNVTVRRNSLENGAWVGISIRGSRAVLVEDNALSNVDQGPAISVEDSSDVLVVGNQITNDAGGISLLRNLNVTAVGNRLLGSGLWIDGDTLEQFRSVDARNNTVNGLTFAAYRDCSDVVFDRAAVAQLFLVDCRRITIRNQTFADLETGAELINVEDAMVESSVFQNLSSDAALRVVWGSNITIEHSNFTRNKGYGIWASHAENLRVVENTMRENYIGMVISNTTTAWIYHNNFIHSGLRPEEALDRATVGTRWDAGYPDGGNYWSYSYGIDQCSGSQQDICGLPDGIKDTPVTVVPDGIDRYPLLKPRGLPSVPPVARIDAPDAPTFHLVVTQPMSFNAWRSSDSDGLIVAYEWDFGDGTRATGDYVTHAWLSGGLFNMTLTVRDNANEVNSTTVRVDVSVPMPVAVLRVQPSGPIYASQRLTFDGGQSRSGWDGGDIASWDWDFGDGTRATGVVVTHAFSTPGTYATRLTVTNQFGRDAAAGFDLAVSAVPDIPMRQYEHHDGFRVPIPSEWVLTEDAEIEGTTFATVLNGPDHEGVPTTIVIATDVEPTVRETNEYLKGVIDGALQGVQAASPGSFLSEGPIYRTIGGHSGVVFAVTEPGPPPLVDKLAVVLSDEHDRFWFLIVIAHADFFLLYNSTFDAMIDGFEIALPSPSGTLLLWASFALATGLAAAVICVLVIRRKKRFPTVVSVGPPSYTLDRSPGLAHRYCTACGAQATEVAQFCGRCGTSLTDPHAVTPTPLSKPPEGSS